MTSSFVPFVPAAQTSTRTIAAAPFAPVIASVPLVAPETSTPPCASRAEAASVPLATEPCAPKITVQRDADRITRIQIHCSCGELIELDCQY
ncbi:MAG TPA: hypothetical protein VMZ27_06880 [Candidatus Saccharimonadales bacterium]|nr:hypothetical protein [Candidatus Saccharimonadales bacterium]